MRDEFKVRDAVDGCAAVCHLAAVASVSASLEDPVGTGSVTHGGTVNVVRQAVEAEVPRFVLASSCAVYGDAAQLPVAETAALRPLSPYAEAKLAAEEACAAAADAGQIAAACLRFFNVYGPRQDPGSEYSGVISRFMDAAAAGEPVTVYGDGGQTRDFVYVGDVVDALVESPSEAAQRRFACSTWVRVPPRACSASWALARGLAAGARLERRFAPRRAPATSATRAPTLGAPAGCWAGRRRRASPTACAQTWEWYARGRDAAGAARPDPCLAAAPPGRRRARRRRRAGERCSR